MESFPKKLRIENEALLEAVRELWCIACGVTPSDAHHVTPKGAGGGDTPTNLMPLCREHHSYWHADPGRAIRRFPSIRYWLEGAGRFDILERYAGKTEASV